MSLRALGIVAPASTTTGQPATQNQTVPTKHFPCMGLSFQVLRTNTGVVYICDRPNPTVATGVGIIIELPIPPADTTVALPVFSVGNPAAPAPVQADKVYVLPAVSGNGVRVGALVT